MSPRVSHELPGPTLPRHFGSSRFAGPRLQVSCCWEPRMPKLRCSGFVPPVCTQIDGLDQIEESHFAIPTCMCFLRSPTPIRRCAMEMGPLCTYGLNPSQLLLQSTVHWSSGLSLINSSHQFPSSREPSVRSLCPMPLKQRRYPSKALHPLELFQSFLEHVSLCSVFNHFLKC